MSQLFPSSGCKSTGGRRSLPQFLSGIEGQVNKAATLWLKGVFQHLSTGEVRNATLVYVRQLGHPPTARMGYPSQPTFKSIARSKSNGVKAKHATCCSTYIPWLCSAVSAKSVLQIRLWGSQ